MNVPSRHCLANKNTNSCYRFVMIDLEEEGDPRALLKTWKRFASESKIYVTALKLKHSWKHNECPL